ncbi:MAG: DsbA family protein, partial [Anaerolineae bacterium]|nr:DsbA family protein [Anaerolineae bacterium]
MRLKMFLMIGCFIFVAACSPTPEETPTPDTEPSVTDEATREITDEIQVTESVITQGDAELIAFYAGIPHSRGADGAFILGDVNAPIKIIKFADFLCPHCQTYHQDVVKAFIQNFVVTGQAKFEYRFFPVIDQQASPYLAVLNECANEQDKFWATHVLLYDLAKNRQLDQNVVTNVATRLGMDESLLSACMAGADPFQFETDTVFGQELSVNGTPAVRVQVGENPVGVIKMGDTEYARGGVDLEALTAFLTSENPADNVVLVNRIIADNLLVDNSLISENENCQLPCWRGITPGETPLTAAQEILGADNTVGNVEYQESGRRVGVSFTQVDKDRICCQLISDGTDNVDYISLQFTPTIT